MHIAEAIGTLPMDIDIADDPMDIDNEPVRPTISTEAMDIEVKLQPSSLQLHHHHHYQISTRTTITSKK